MKIEQLLSPSFLEQSPEERIAHIRHIRSQRHFTKPSVVKRQTKSRKSKIKKALEKMSPEEKAALLRKLRGQSQGGESDASE